jgi:hypothetical protein
VTLSIILICIGACAVTFGVGLVSVPAAVVVGGLVACGAGVAVVPVRDRE